MFIVYVTIEKIGHLKLAVIILTCKVNVSLLENFLKCCHLPRSAKFTFPLIHFWTFKNVNLMPSACPSLKKCIYKTRVFCAQKYCFLLLFLIKFDIKIDKINNDVDTFNKDLN